MLNGLQNQTILSLNDVLAKSSRYRGLGVLDYNGKTMLDVPDPLSYVETSSSSEKTIVIQDNVIDRLDLLSWKYYGTPKYWWILAYYNSIENPFSLPYGTIVRIPDMQTLLLSQII